MELRGFSCKNVHVAEIEICDLSRKPRHNMEEETVCNLGPSTEMEECNKYKCRGVVVMFRM